MPTHSQHDTLLQTDKTDSVEDLSRRRADTKARERFAYLQSTARQAADKARAYAGDLRSRTQQNRLETLQRAETRASDRFFSFLDTIASRQFRSGVPCHWILEELLMAWHEAQTIAPTLPAAENKRKLASLLRQWRE